MADHMRTIPEVFENNVTECLLARTKQLGKIVGLGPPDLCHITKVQEKPQSILRSGPAPPSLIGSYHHVYGVDCSSPAAIAAYFNTLVNDLGNPTMSKGVWRIQSGTYCSYNAFARVDVRVEVTMPGTVNAYVLDAQGRRFGCDDRMWQEVHVCAVLRSLARPDPFVTHIDCLRYFYPFNSPSDEVTFLKAAEELFWEGKFLGTDELTAPPNNVNNRLAVGIRTYFFDSCRYAQGLDFFARFQEQDEEVSTVPATAMDQFSQTSSAVCLLARRLLHVTPTCTMLLCQSQLLLNMGQTDRALQVAKLAVDLAPAQAQPWINLATMYVANQNYPMALVALNVAPMAHGTEFVPPEMPDPQRIVNNSEVMREMVEEEEEGDQTLSSLPANSLRGTFVEAYSVLTRILSEITWDELLAYRSRVFLMEDEYAQPMRQDDIKEADEEGDEQEVPTETPADSTPEGEESPQDTTTDAENPETPNGTTEESSEISKPDPAVPGPVSEQTIPGGKRLLERWLDQLFTALYQDLMCSVIWNAQDQHAQRTNTKIEHTIGDYLRFGILSRRLGRKDEACRAFQQCTSQGFCLRGLFNILETYSSDGFVEETLATVDAICQFYEINPELAVPHAVNNAVYRLIAKHGLAMMTQLGGRWLTKSPHVKKIVEKATLWKVRGYDK